MPCRRCRLPCGMLLCCAQERSALVCFFGPLTEAGSHTHGQTSPDQPGDDQKSRNAAVHGETGRRPCHHLHSMHAQPIKRHQRCKRKDGGVPGEHNIPFAAKSRRSQLVTKLSVVSWCHQLTGKYQRQRQHQHKKNDQHQHTRQHKNKNTVYERPPAAFQPPLLRRQQALGGLDSMPHTCHMSHASNKGLFGWHHAILWYVRPQQQAKMQSHPSKVEPGDCSSSVPTRCVFKSQCATSYHAYVCWPFRAASLVL